MHGIAPCSLDAASLARRLRDLAGDERQVQVDFLLHMDEFDRRQAYLPLGFGSLWDYLLRELHLREGAAGRRIAAMRALRRFPRLELPLRDRRLCLSTAPLLAQVLTEENLDDLVARAAFKTKAEVEHLVASIQPRTAPRDGLRRLPEPRAASVAQPLAGFLEPPFLSAPETGAPGAEDCQATAAPTPAAGVTASVRCGIERHGKRRGAVPPSRKRKKRALRPEPEISDPSERIPIDVKRAVHERDGGRCAFVSRDGRRCGSRWQLEFDHIEPRSQGGESTVENVRIACRAHNFRHAEETYGRGYMAKYRRRGTRTGENAVSGGSHQECKPPHTTDGKGSRAGPSRAHAPPDEPGLPLSGR
ncbi:MAG TPA: HNH endonuclease [Anaeromyxobacteraceae bacterium]|nr:HNH endonuclease [Anaeromyxobacteraceae bacterium]